MEITGYKSRCALNRPRTIAPGSGSPVNESHEKAPSEDALFISGVIEFALLLRDSEYKGNASRQAIIARLSELNSVENDEYKKEFLELVEKYNK